MMTVNFGTLALAKALTSFAAALAVPPPSRPVSRARAARGAAEGAGSLRPVGVGDGRDELRAVLGDAAVLVLLADHEAGDVLQEDERYAARAAQLYKVRALERALGEQDAVVGQDSDRVPVDVGEAAHQRLAVK